MDKGKLISSGINVEEGLVRFSNSEKLYTKYLLKFIDLQTFDDLFTAIEEQRYEDAFGYAHQLKSFVGNLSMYELYDSICDITEQLRNHDLARINDVVEKAKEQRMLLCEAIKGATI